MGEGTKIEEAKIADNYVWVSNFKENGKKVKDFAECKNWYIHYFFPQLKYILEQDALIVVKGKVTREDVNTFIANVEKSYKILFEESPFLDLDESIEACKIFAEKIEICKLLIENKLVFPGENHYTDLLYSYHKKIQKIKNKKK